MLMGFIKYHDCDQKSSELKTSDNGLSSGLRKLSIGEDSSRAPERLRNTWNAETGRRDGEVFVFNLFLPVLLLLLLVHLLLLPFLQLLLPVLLLLPLVPSLSPSSFLVSSSFLPLLPLPAPGTLRLLLVLLLHLLPSPS